jgi:hypothetical protein
VSEPERRKVSKWRLGETVGQVIIANSSNPLNLFVDRSRSVYVIENSGNRVVKVNYGTMQILTVAGGSHGNSTDQLSSPNSVIVDQLGTVYVADTDNERIMRWPRGATSGSVVAGGHGHGSQSDHFWDPTDLSFDLDGNLYVSDPSNHRIQKFAIDKSLC